MSEVFVSYKAEDRARVAPLVEALAAEGHSVWWDAHIGGGEEWRDEIAGHLEAAGCVIVVWSKRSVGKDGHFVRDEATRALRRGTYLPIRIDKVEPPLGFGETQALPLLGWKGSRTDPQYGAIAAAVSARLGKEHKAHVTSVGLDRRQAIAAGAVALVAAGAGGWYLLKPGSAEANSIAVLPFANLSGDPAQGYFSDGMAEELRSALSRIAGLKVVARTSSEMMRDSDAKTAARKLGVQNIVSGSVRRSPSTIRVNAQLVDGGNGLERWSETFDRPAGDVLAIQSEIAERVAQALSIRLGATDRTMMKAGGTQDPEAQDLYLQARNSSDDSETGVRRTLSLLDAAIARDPGYADAYALKAQMLNVMASVYAHNTTETRRFWDQALESANRAIGIAPRLARGYSTRGLTFRNKLEFRKAMADLERADALPGRDVAVLRNLATMLSQTGRHEDALAKGMEATRLDPIDPVSLEFEASILLYARRYAEAVATARRSLEIAPQRVRVRSVLANSLLFLGRPQEAAVEYGKLPSKDYRRLLGVAVLAAQAGDRAEALDILKTMGAEYGDSAHYQYAEVLAQLGDTDRAIQELKIALATPDPGMATIKVDPFLDPIRRDRRFAAIIQSMNFPST